MKRITIDIPDDKLDETLSYLESEGVEIYFHDLNHKIRPVSGLYKEKSFKEPLVDAEQETEMDETTYLLSSSANASRLLNALKSFNNKPS